MNFVAELKRRNVIRMREKGWPSGCRPLGDIDFECGIDASQASKP